MEKLILIVIIALLFSGCAFRNDYIVSRAKSSMGKNINYSKIDYPDFSLHLRLYNDIRTFKSTAALVVPIEYDNKPTKYVSFRSSKGDKYDFDSEFRILLTVFPKKPDIKIDLKKIVLSIDDAEYSVSSVDGPKNYFPYLNFAFPKDLSENGKKNSIKKGYIFSIPEKNEKKATLNEELLLNKVGFWRSYELVFSVPTPLPKQNISLEILGLLKRNKKYVIPSIEFKEARFVDLGSSL